jgi:predicted Zn-dependent protease
MVLALSAQVSDSDKKNRSAGVGINLYSTAREIAFGTQMAQEEERQASIVSDPVINEYVNRVVQNLVRNSDSRVSLMVKVIDSEEIDAFALPGGFLFVSSDILLRAESEAQMASTMVEEIEKLFSTQPSTDERTRRSQEFIRKYWKQRTGDAVYQKDFDDVKARTIAIHNRRNTGDK